ncbi:MAG: DJ-1 family glyoxalase III [Candidatus Ornithospirochaeta sp.]
MKKALVFLADGFEVCEALCVVDVLRRAGVAVTTCGVEKKNVVSSHKVEVVADALLSDCVDSDWDLVFAPGGMPGATNLASSPLVNEAILKANEKGAIVSAICASPAVVLGPLGLLRSGMATCYPGCEGYAKNVEFVPDGVVVDGNVITAKSAGWAFDLGLVLVSKLLGEEKREKVRASIYYKDKE